MARILFATFGSYGDVHPYMAVGIELRQRGHAVTIATSATYAAKVASEGLAFHAVRPDLSLDNTALLAYVMDTLRGSERVVRHIGAVVRESYEDTLPAARQADLIVTHPITFGAVLVAEKLGLPWVSSVLAPISFLSAWDPPVPAPVPGLIKLRALGPGFMRAVWQLAKFDTRRWLKPVLALRSELALPDRGHPLFEGSHSTGTVLALFSRYLAEPQPDWPPRTVVTGFPFFDRHHEQQAIAPELDRFLSAGPAPVVFTLGSSAVAAAGDFYRDSLKAVETLGVRAVFLTGAYSQGLPAKLPASVIAIPYAPHSEIFPRASAIVHQGGVGTTAQAMRSGRPMLVVPFAHDQFDNGERVRRFGAADVVYRSRYHAATAAAALCRLLHRDAAAAKLGELVRAENGTAKAADAIERALQ
uniref:Glycosyl transferase, family 28 n=1 Tax=Solibacter usitatus (strain Ellin6076) TaxID=234267 RepID=Q023U1_SOLUE